MTYQTGEPIIVPFPPQYGVRMDIFERLQGLALETVTYKESDFIQIHAYDWLTQEYYLFQFSSNAIGASIWMRSWGYMECMN